MGSHIHQKVNAFCEFYILDILEDVPEMLAGLFIYRMLTLESAERRETRRNKNKSIPREEMCIMQP